MKRFILALALLLSVAAGALIPAPVSAAPTNPPNNQQNNQQNNQPSGGGGGSLFGFQSIFQGTSPDSVTDGESLKGFVAIVVANIAVDLSLAVGYIAVAMIAWTGITFMMSSGDPGKLASAKKMLFSAITGMIIAFSASTISKFISNTLSAADASSGEFLWNLINTVLSFGGIIAVGMIVMSAFKYITAQGDPNALKQATRGIIWSVVGLIIVISAAAIVNFVIKAV